MPRRKPYAPSMTEQIAVRSTASVLHRYYSLHNDLALQNRVRFFGKRLTKEAMLNALVLWAAE